MTLKDLADKANRLLAEGADPDLKVYTVDLSNVAIKASSLGVWKTESLQEWAHGTILDEADESVAMLS